MASDRDEDATAGVGIGGPVRAMVRRADPVSVVTLAVAALALVVFGKLLQAVRENDRMVRIDEAATEWISHHRGDSLDDVMQVVTRLADPLVVASLVILALAVLLARRQPGAALFILASSAGAAILVRMTKTVVGRQRPTGGVIAVSGASFPSGHAAQSIALYGAIALAAASVIQTPWRRLAVLATAALVALLVGI
jgi:undecaprenyl-diphosphatase